MDSRQFNDQPKSLANPQAREARLSMLHEPHIEPLTKFVERMRAETGYGDKIPYFDPLDGGIEAVCLFLNEAPGPKAVESGLISRNNPDETAKNFMELNQEAGIPRRLTVSWNIVPWYIGTGRKIRPARVSDIQAGIPHLNQLIRLLPHLKIVVLAGRKAQKAAGHIRLAFPRLEIVETMHTSPLVINTKKENREKLLEQLHLVSECLSANRL